MKTEEIMNLREAQKAIYQNKVDKGFNTSDVNKEFCLLYGEVAEAYDAWRKKKENVGEELADVAIYLLGLSEILGVDLAEEIEKKMRINQNRQCQDVNGVLLKKTEI
jgi:NTP pyrophosphatase (non-canonical NTP hydrolase)